MPLIRKSCDLDAGTVCLQWSIDGSNEQIWNALVDPAVLPYWLGPMISGTFAVGKIIEIEHAQDYVCTSRILGCEPARSLSMTWEFPDEDPSRISFTIESTRDTRILTLEHTELTRDIGDYLTGWSAHLLYLENYVNGTPRPMNEFWEVFERMQADS